MNQQQPLEWVEEYYWFGSACWPPDATYRRAGPRVQRQIEERVKLERQPLGDDSTPALFTWDGTVTHFERLDGCIDVRITIHPKRTIGDQTIAPTAFLLGWRDLASDEEREFYEQMRDSRYLVPKRQNAQRGPTQ